MNSHLSVVSCIASEASENILLMLLLPVWGEVDAGLRTAWAEERQASRSRRHVGPMTKTMPLHQLEQPPLPSNPDQFSVPVLLILKIIAGTICPHPLTGTV
jgi:hypothetical protein